MEIKPKFKILILIFMTMPFYGCFTSKVTSLADYQPKSEKLVKINSANISKDNTIDIVFIGKYAGSRKENIYNIRLNIDTIIAMNKIPNTSVVFSPEIIENTGILKIDYLKTNDSCSYLVYLDRKKLMKMNNKEINVEENDISSRLKPDLNYKYDGFNSENQIIITYFPESKDFHNIAFGIGTEWKNNKWCYVLYPFSIVIDIITFPVQFIYFVLNYKHPFKN